MNERPLAGLLVLDASRMLPGAVLARCLLDLGARVIKIEAPGTGDPMRLVPPLADGIGAGFAEHYRGAESIVLDLRRETDAGHLRTLARRADVFVESFRPGTLERWGLAPATLHDDNPRLCTVRLPAAPAATDDPLAEVGHDLNVTARSGLLARLGTEGVPRVLLADVATGLLAAQALLAALLLRARTGCGTTLEQPIAAGPLPFLWWPWADLAHGATRGATDTLLAGEVAAYRVYRCADGLRLSVACLEPKFWIAFCDAVERKDLIPGGLEPGPRGRACSEAMQAHLATRPRAHWMGRLAGRALPVAPVHETVEATAADPLYATTALSVPGPGATRLPGPALPGLGVRPEARAPALGAHTARIFREFGCTTTGP